MITITAVRPEDRDEWLELWSGYLTFYKAELSPATTDATFARLTTPGSGLYGALARDEGGRAVGLVHWLTHLATWSRTDYCYLEDLFVSPDARGSGVGAALIAWSLPMLYADRTGTQKRGESEVTWKDTLLIGVVQCLALIPGISRSGATMTAGLLRGIDRVTVTRLSFMLSVPALTAAGILQAVTEAGSIAGGVGWPATLTATLVSFGVAYVAVSWLLRFIAGHSYTVFIVYRILLGALVLALVASGTLAAT